MKRESEADAGVEASKRACTEQCPVIRKSLIDDPAERKALHDFYVAAKPYRHCVIDNVFDNDLLASVRAEVLENLSATCKETDIYKVLQTGDFGNIDGLGEDERSQLGKLKLLRDTVYSREFRKFVEDVTGCRGLSEQVDCAANLHPLGGHLLCHDDVIGTRAVSYIIYMPDPKEETWKAEDGGALELYPLEDNEIGTPAVSPSNSVLPIWNRVAMFSVEPGVSFHSVQEVFSNRLRCSIQGWFHTDSPPEGADKASLNQLQRVTGIPRTLAAYAPDEIVTLSTEDKQYLEPWINPAYLEEKAIAQIAAVFAQNSSVQLRNFLRKDVAKRLQTLLVAQDDADGLGSSKPPKHGVGVCNGWTQVGPPHVQRFLWLDGDAAPAGGEEVIGTVLLEIISKVLASKAIAHLVAQATGVVPTQHRATGRRFRPGLDYTLAHTTPVDPGCSVIDATLCFVNDRKKKLAAAWSSDEVGGYECSMPAGESTDDPAIYRSGDSSDDIVSESAAHNTMSFVLRDPKMLHFVKYVSAHAPGSRWDIKAEFHGKASNST